MSISSIASVRDFPHPRAVTTGDISPIAEIIDEARNGRMFILVDDKNRENEGDLIIPAQMVTPDAINFMAKYARGLVCLAITEARAAELQLSRMPRTSTSAFDTAFTVSIEAREGVTTGISAADRARTIAVAIDGNTRAGDLVSPGHVFPLIAREGGVLRRAGHTEAAVDIARIAGLNAAGVICEIMRDDGAMARLPDLVPFARAHGLKIGMIHDLIAYRCRHDRAVGRVGDIPFVSRFGQSWRVLTYRDPIAEKDITVLTKGNLRGKPLPVAIHRPNVLADLCGGAQTGPRSMEKLMLDIAERRSGCVIIDSGSGMGSAQILGELCASALDLIAAPEEMVALLEELAFDIVEPNNSSVVREKTA